MKNQLFVKFSAILEPPFLLIKLQIRNYRLYKHIITFLRKNICTFCYEFIGNRSFDNMPTFLDPPFLIWIVIKIYAENIYSLFNFQQIKKETLKSVKNSIVGR